ncbi:MAG: 50S ribosomal protein L7/L12 [bacterium]|nr:50S ribosomal protein L7/L12 [bacterium]
MADEEKQEDVTVPKKFKSLVENVEKLSVLELSELVKVLEKKFGVSSVAPMAVAAPASAEATTGEEEKTSFTIQLTGVGSQKIEVIKVVRDATQKGLKEAKDLVDAAASSPQVVKEEAPKEEADELKKRFEAAGATVELK